MDKWVYIGLARQSRVPVFRPDYPSNYHGTKAKNMTHKFKVAFFKKAKYIKKNYGSGFEKITTLIINACIILFRLVSKYML